MTNASVIKYANKPKLSVKVQTLATVVAVVSAVAIPQVFHFIGYVSGLGTSLGETFLPMHLPIILVGLLAGPYAGAISGFLAPLLSFAIAGMPGKMMLPFMMIELLGYGFFAGLLSNVKISSFSKVLISQFAGRAVRAVAILIAVYALGNDSIAVSTIWLSVLKGLPGIALQWALLPLIVFYVDNKSKKQN